MAQPSKVINHDLDGVQVSQRKADSYINATAMSKAYLARTGQRRDVNHWLTTEAAQRAIEHLSLKTGIPVFKLVEARKGRYGGTLIHPKLAIRFGIWLDDDFGYLVEEWVAEWMTNGRNPFTQEESERILYRENLKSESRLRLTDQMMFHLKRIQRYADEVYRGVYFSRIHNEINRAITGEDAKEMRQRLSQVLGREVKTHELIRDYYPAIHLQRFIAICEVAANLMLNGIDPLTAVKQAASLALPAHYKPEPIDFTVHIGIIRQKGA